MIRLHDSLSSGNGYKVRLLLRQLDIPFERIEVDIDAGETRTEAYLAKNPNGKIPAVELETGDVLSESDAILFYFADGTPLLPATRIGRAKALQWMFFEQYSHEPYIAVARFMRTHLESTPEIERTIEGKMPGGYRALDVMEQHLRSHEYFVDGAYGIADIALYAYTHVAAEGGFDLDGYPSVRAWLARVVGQRGHVTIDDPC